MRIATTAFFVAIVVVPDPSAHAQSPPPQRIGYDLTAMYEAVNPSIVKVHVDSGSGSGFLVRQDGLIATNHHVIRNSRYVAVEFPDGRKVTADVVALDAQRDVAVLKVHRALVERVKTLPLLHIDRDETVKAGIPVVAFGSPLSQTFLMTQGIVSKVEVGVLLGDFLIQPGNSGGPLVNLEGDVIGINTFAEGRVSGAVRINVLRDVLSQPQLAADRLVEPSESLLPSLRKGRYPTDLLKSKILREPLDTSAYSVDGGKFTITAFTPVLAAKVDVQDQLQQAANRYSRRGKKIKDEKYDPIDEPFYDWVRNADSRMDVAVRFLIRPDFGATAGSVWASVLSGVAAGLSKTTATPTKQTMEFKAEFADFKLYRNGEFVAPITPGREITEQSLDSPLLAFVDEAYSGVYTYAPEVFLSGHQWRLDVYDAREPGRVHKSVLLTSTSKLIVQIRQDFAEVPFANSEPSSRSSIVFTPAAAPTAAPSPGALVAPTDRKLASLEFLNGHAVLRYDPTEWSPISSDNPSTLQLAHRDGGVYFRVTSGSSGPVNSTERLIQQATRSLNGIRFTWTETEAMLGSTPYTYYSFNYTGAIGTFQLSGFARRAQMSKYRAAIETLAAGFDFTGR